MKIIFISLVSILLPVLNSIAEGVIVIEGSKIETKEINIIFILLIEKNVF